MSRYIDADKLKSEFDFKHIDMNKTAAVVHHKNILEIINQQPTADVVEVVRCKDCKHRTYDKSRDLYYCEMYYGLGSVRDGNYCSFGERAKE